MPVSVSTPVALLKLPVMLPVFTNASTSPLTNPLPTEIVALASKVPIVSVMLSPLSSATADPPPVKVTVPPAVMLGGVT